MTERAGKAKQMSKRQQPSRLRNEVCPDSTDDERNRKKSTVQVPDSDVFVPETQLDHDGSFHHDDPGPDNESELTMSPNSADLLKRTAVAKKGETIEHIPFTFKLLSRAPTGLNDNAASASPNPFGLPYLSTRRASTKTSPTEETTAAKSSTHVGSATYTKKHETHGTQDVMAMAEPTPVSPPLLPNNSHHDEPRFISNQEVYILDQPVTRQRQEKQGPMHSNATSDILPSAQPDAKRTSGTSRVPGAKKSKKARKGRLSQQLEGPRPPRSRVTPRYAPQVETTSGPATETSTYPLRLSQMKTDGNGVYASRAHAMQAPALIEYSYGHTHAQESQLPNEEHGRIAYDNKTCNTAPSPVDTTLQDLPDSSAQREFSTPSVRVPSALHLQLDVTEPKQQLLATVHDLAGDLRPDEQAVSSIQASGPYALSNSHGSVDKSTVLTQSHQPELNAETNRVACQPSVTEALLHSTYDRNGPSRITKPRRKPRPSGPIAQSHQVQVISLSVENSIENLRVAILADTYRTQHESTTANKQHEAEIAKLQRKIDDQAKAIAEYDRSHQSLSESISQLTNRAQTNQRLVTGLQQDYEKLQKSATESQKQSKNMSTERITELEDERRALKQDFEFMTDKLAATQRKMRSTIDDVYVQFVISESKRKNLVENLGKQEAVLEGERRKRDEMEKQLLSRVQVIPRQVIDSSDALTKKIELLQTSLDNATAHDDRNGQIKECLNALQTLRLTPTLTMQDIEKMDGTLRLVHERLDSRLDTLSETVACKAPSDAELRKFIKDQLHGLQTNMLQYEDITAENRKTHESNVVLQSQLEAQQQHSNQLEKRIRGYQQAEVDLKTRSDQLERDLKELRDAQLIDITRLEQEALALCQQLQKAAEDLKAVNTKVEKIDQEKNRYQSCYEDVKTQLQELQQKSVTEDDTAVREKIAKDYESRFAEKEHSFKSEIHELKIERDEKETTLQELSSRLDAADTQLDELSEKIQTLESESAKTTNLQEQLWKTTEELHAKDRDYAELKHKHQEKTKKMLEADSELTKVRHDASTMRQLSFDQISSLQQEKKELSTRLEQIQMNEGKLQHEVAQLCAAKEADVRRVQAEAGEENRKLVEQHRTELDDYRRRIGQKDIAFKEVEAKLRLAEDQHRNKVAADREKAESNMLKLEQKYQDLLRGACEQGHLNQQDGSRGQNAKKTLSESGETTQAAKLRENVSRQNHSMLEVSQEQNQHSERSPSTFHAEILQTQLEDDDLFATQFKEQGRINDISNDPDDVDHAPEAATGIRNTKNLSMTQDAFKEDLLRASQHQLKRQVSGSSDLSNMPTDELTRIEMTQPVSPVVSRSYSRDPFNHGMASTDVGVTLAIDNESVAGSQSSRSSGRPKSQANTASRMMPPPGNYSTHHRPGIGNHAANPGTSTRHKTYGKANPELGSSDFKSSKPSSSKQIYSQYDPRRSVPTGSQYGSLQDVRQGRTEKRKGSIDQTEKDSITKKQRTRSQPRPSKLSQSRTPVSSSHPRNRVSRRAPSSGGAYSSRGQSSSQVAASGPIGHYSTRVTRSKSRNGTALGDGFNERFNEELDQRR